MSRNSQKHGKVRQCSRRSVQFPRYSTVFSAHLLSLPCFCQKCNIYSACSGDLPLLFFDMLFHIVRITLQRETASLLPTCNPGFELSLCLQVLGRLCDRVRYLHRMRRSIFWFLPWRPLTLSKVRESIRTHEAIAYAAPRPHVDINIRTTKTIESV